jgi:hypothetical protein
LSPLELNNGLLLVVDNLLQKYGIAHNKRDVVWIDQPHLTHYVLNLLVKNRYFSAPLLQNMRIYRFLKKFAPKI